ncbi:uncharacterized protein LOC127963523 [Carassius gibelio]|uniref:uncharacterized protein LOC127963523 n=1 Tax=Carassius gibelio TaxID=101364 RepID=UPI001637BB86|nr:uncharacterized protein LOC127963523 [Carassius gibelio]
MNQLHILILALLPAFNSDTSFFLIYNEDRKTCVYTKSTTVVQSAPCNESSKAQHFRWTSSSQIFSRSFNLCLGSKNIKERAKIILLPCNGLDPVHIWECKDKSLFGLKGHKLHLNQGKDPNLMLFSGIGVWSQWLIYRTKENLCSHGYKDVPVPNITVFRQMEDREHMIVMCSFGKRFNESSFQLSLKSEQNYTLKNPLCNSSEKWVFEVNRSLPVSFTCVHETDSVVNRQSETYTYSPSDFAEDYHEEGVSLYYICLFSSVGAGLFIITAAVIVTTIRSKTNVIGGPPAIPPRPPRTTG